VGIQIEDIFKVNGIPSHTFVEPSEFGQLKVALRTPGRGVVVEGPSGIGKSTAVAKALESIAANAAVTKLSARNPEDIEYLELLPELGGVGTVIVDDFHRLEDATKARLADLLKLTADTEDETRKLVVIGINDASRALIEFAPDLSNRIDVIPFEAEPQSKIDELVTAGEAAANVQIAASHNIIEKAGGSFYIAQLLCLEACVQAGYLESAPESTEIVTSYAAIQRRVVERQQARFGNALRSFARGTKFRPGGRAPYLHILRWLAESDSWSINILEEMRRHATEKISVGVVVDRGYLAALVEQPEIAKLMHLSSNNTLSVEDPMLVYYLRSISWETFIADVGFTKVDYTATYDAALSFAGEDRAYAEHIRDALEDAGHAIFYDLAEQHLILAEDVEAYLGPIYAKDCRYVVAVLGQLYGTKRWTLFEADQYRDRIDQGVVIPIWSTKIPPTPFDESRRRGGLHFDPDGDLRAQATAHAEVISKKLAGTP
jgi:hypothetical protein